jgi:hypothetical protein
VHAEQVQADDQVQAGEGGVEQRDRQLRQRLCRLRLIGRNRDFARYAGISTGVYALVPLGLSGGLHGLAGAHGQVGHQAAQLIDPIVEQFNVRYPWAHDPERLARVKQFDDEQGL